MAEKQRQRYTNKNEQEKAVMLKKQRIDQVGYHICDTLIVIMAVTIPLQFKFKFDFDSFH
jgi:hypothetical protein